MKKLPEHFVIKHPGKHLLWQKYIDWLNDTYLKHTFKLSGNNSSAFYGFRGSSKFTNMITRNPIKTTIFTLEEWDSIVNQKKEFVLPEKWCVNRENSKLIQDWFTENASTNSNNYSNRLLGWYTHWPSWGGGNSHTSQNVKSGYTEISHNQFVAFVLNKQNN